MTEPSKYFAQHHAAVEAPTIDERSFRPFWRVRTHLDALLLDGAIGFPVWRAGVEYRTLAELVLAGSLPGASNGDLTDTIRGGFDAGMARRMDAIGRLKAINRAIGGFAAGILEEHLVNDVKWVELGKLYAVHPKTVRAWTIVVLKALAETIWNGGRHVRQGI